MADVSVIDPQGRIAKLDETELQSPAWQEATKQGFRLAPSPSMMPSHSGAVPEREETPQAVTAALGFDRGLFPFAKQLVMGAGMTGGGAGTNPEGAPSPKDLSRDYDTVEKQAFQDNPKTRAISEAAGAFTGMAAGGGAGQTRRATRLAQLEQRVAPQVAEQMPGKLAEAYDAAQKAAPGMTAGLRPGSPEQKELANMIIESVVEKAHKALPSELTAKALGAGQAAKDAGPFLGNVTGAAIGLPIPYGHLIGIHAGGAAGAALTGSEVASQARFFSPYKNLERILTSPAVANQISRLTPAAGGAVGAGVTPFADLLRAANGSSDK